MAPSGWTQRRRLRGHDASIDGLSWSHDGHKLATFDTRGGLVLWDMQSGKPLHAYRPSAPIRGVAWSPEDDAIAVVTAEIFDEVDSFENYSSTEDEDALLAAFEKDSSGQPLLDVGDNVPLHVRLFDTDSGLHIGTVSFREHDSPPEALVWPKRDRLFAAASDGITAWQPEDGHYLGRLENPNSDKYECIATTPSGDLLAAAGRGGTVALWEDHSGNVKHYYESDRELFTAVAIAPGFDWVASGCEAGDVEIWHFTAHDLDIRTLEGHTAEVTDVSFSADGHLLATSSLDGSIKLWDTRDWSLLSETKRRQGRAAAFARFSPRDKTLLAGTTGADNAARTWTIDPSVLAARRQSPETVHYTNAKVVLLGDSGVGKTGLGLVLSGQSFRATESTHQRNVWMLPGITGDAAERREAFLWDLAGQPGYRLLHQLHLSDIAVAVVVFDARNEVDPLSGVRHWARALSQVSRQTSQTQGTITRILVAARVDRGGAKVSDAELRKVRREFGFSHYVTTSAKESRGVASLARTIEQAITWEHQPKVSSTRLFDAIRGFLLQKRDTELLLVTEAELRDAFIATDAISSKEIDAEFRVCVDRAQARGLVRRFSFGNLILLRPEVVDAYAAAVLHAAGADPDGFGEIKESLVREARFAIPEDSRPADEATERLLLIATIEDLLRHEVALREDSDDGAYLVFPTQTRNHLDLKPQLKPWCRFSFEGPVQHVWATLVVRLAHSGVFVRDEVGDDCAVFRSGGENLALRLVMPDEGEATIHLLAETSEPDHLERLLERFVEAHLRRRAIWNSVVRAELVVCPRCGFVVPEALIDALVTASSFNCPRCPERIEQVPSSPVTADSEGSRRAEVRHLENAADDERRRVASRTAVQGKEAVHEFDAFIAYNSADSEAAEVLSDRLRDAGLNPWLDKERIPPGRWVQDVLQDAIGRSASAVICLGPQGLGKWQAVELRTFVSECIDRDIPVIPTLIPGAEFPKDALFLKELEYVRFHKKLDEPKPLKRLIWGITGRQE
jgi:WD40 repeat protein